jgi:predicted transcriptional regulator
LDAESTDRVALLSIHPEFAEAIMSGRKRVEFRKVPFGSDVRTVVVYATRPVARVVGTFDVIGIEQRAPSRLWDMFGQVGGISRRRFSEYFQGHRTGYAIRVGTVRRFATPVPLSHLGNGLVPPQSFRYLQHDVAIPKKYAVVR